MATRSYQAKIEQTNYYVSTTKGQVGKQAVFYSLSKRKIDLITATATKGAIVPAVFGVRKVRFANTCLWLLKAVYIIP